MQSVCRTIFVIAIYRGNMSDLAVFQICYKECLYNLLAQIIIVRYDKIITLG